MINEKTENFEINESSFKIVTPMIWIVFILFFITFTVITFASVFAFAFAFATVFNLLSFIEFLTDHGSDPG